MTNSFCSWTASFLARKTTPCRSRTGRAGRRRGYIGAALRGTCFLFSCMLFCIPPQAFGLVGSTITRAEVEVHFFSCSFVFLVSDRHALLLPAALFPPHRALNMNGIRGVLAGVTTNDLYRDCDLRLWGTLWCSAKYLIAKDWAARTWKGGHLRTGRIGKPLLCFPRPLFSSSTGKREVQPACLG